MAFETGEEGTTPTVLMQLNLGKHCVFLQMYKWMRTARKKPALLRNQRSGGAGIYLCLSPTVQQAGLKPGDKVLTSN